MDFVRFSGELAIYYVLIAAGGGSAWLYLRFLRGQGSFAALDRWQTAYLPVYSVWAAFVVTVFPSLFGFR
jgi:hypothetical protein